MSCRAARPPQMGCQCNDGGNGFAGAPRATLCASRAKILGLSLPIALKRTIYTELDEHFSLRRGGFDDAGERGRLAIA
jgi:hypothetical protein